jgi:sporulation protein YhbH
MGIVNHDSWDLSEKGMRDAQRHREKIDKAIRENVRDVIADESIITRKEGRKVKIPVKGLRDYRFVYGIPENRQGGIGQGKGKSGDVIDERPIDGDGNSRRAGDKPGEDFIETEVDIDYLINIMFQELGLPYIQEKTKIQHLVPKGWKFETISKVGVNARIHKHRTLIETIKRQMEYAHEIIAETGVTEEIALAALELAKGDLIDAIELIKKGITFTVPPSGDVFIEDDDLRFKQIEEDMQVHSNAVVLSIMDTSGSMTIEKKYLARSMLFWMVEFLKKAYSNVGIKFITHTTDAKVVDEEEFFKKGESGGTFCHTGFDLADYLIETEFPVDTWNVYVVYISDGEDFDTKQTLISIKKILDRKVNMIGYMEIHYEDGWGGGSNLLDAITNKFPFKITTDSGTNFYKNEDLHFLAGVIKGREHIYPALKHLLFEKKKG